MTTSWRVRFAVLAGPILAGLGCQSGHVPNPNDPADVGPLAPATVRRNLKAVTDDLGQRFARHEIDQKQYRQLVEKAASEIAAQADASAIDPAHAWEYGEVLRDAHHWKLAEPVLRVAVQNAIRTKNEDRRVNDSLRLATVLAQEGKIPEAIAMARSVFDAPPKESAPILLATYLELVPAARGKGHDLELARLVQDAIPIQLRTQVDPKTDEGRMFELARPYHVRQAWNLAAELYDKAGRPDLAKEARANVKSRRPNADPGAGSHATI